MVQKNSDSGTPSTLSERQSQIAEYKKKLARQQAEINLTQLEVRKLQLLEDLDKVELQIMEQQKIVEDNN